MSETINKAMGPLQMGAGLAASATGNPEIGVPLIMGGFSSIANSGQTAGQTPGATPQQSPMSQFANSPMMGAMANAGMQRMMPQQQQPQMPQPPQMPQAQRPQQQAGPVQMGTPATPPPAPNAMQSAQNSPQMQMIMKQLGLA